MLWIILFRPSTKLIHANSNYEKSWHIKFPHQMTFLFHFDSIMQVLIFFARFAPSFSASTVGCNNHQNAAKAYYKHKTIHTYIQNASIHNQHTCTVWTTNISIGTRSCFERCFRLTQTGHQQRLSHSFSLLGRVTELLVWIHRSNFSCVFNMWSWGK